MRIPAPIHGKIREARYREDHSGVPWLMQLFIYCARMASFFILLTLIGWIPLAAVPLTFSWSLSYTIFDIYTRMGFIMFRRLIGDYPWKGDE